MRIIGASIGFGAERLEQSTSSAACSRGRVTSMRLPKSGRASNQRRCSRSADDAADDEDGRTRGADASRALDQLCERAGDRLLGRQRAVVDDHRRSVGWPAVGDERVEDARQLLRPGVADDRAVEPRQAGPVDVGRRAALVLVPAHERDVSPPPG